MQIDLINQYDGRLSKRVGTVRISLKKATSYIDRPGNHRAIAEAELVNRYPAVGRFELNVRYRNLPACAIILRDCLNSGFWAARSSFHAIATRFIGP